MPSKILPQRLLIPIEVFHRTDRGLLDVHEEIYMIRFDLRFELRFDAGNVGLGSINLRIEIVHPCIEIVQSVSTSHAAIPNNDAVASAMVRTRFWLWRIILIPNTQEWAETRIKSLRTGHLWRVSLKHRARYSTGPDDSNCTANQLAGVPTQECFDWRHSISSDHWRDREQVLVFILTSREISKSVFSTLAS
jgi:hypothetical protein